MTDQFDYLEVGGPARRYMTLYVESLLEDFTWALICDPACLPSKLSAPLIAA
jgi:hypothetical protein